MKTCLLSSSSLLPSTALVSELDFPVQVGCFGELGGLENVIRRPPELSELLDFLFVPELLALLGTEVPSSGSFSSSVASICLWFGLETERVFPIPAVLRRVF